MSASASKGLSGNAAMRIARRIEDPYDGIIYEGINPRHDQWVTLRFADLRDLLNDPAACQTFGPQMQAKKP